MTRAKQPRTPTYDRPFPELTDAELRRKALGLTGEIAAKHELYDEGLDVDDWDEQDELTLVAREATSRGITLDRDVRLLAKPRLRD